MDSRYYQSLPLTPIYSSPAPKYYQQIGICRRQSVIMCIVNDNDDVHVDDEMTDIEKKKKDATLFVHENDERTV